MGSIMELVGIRFQRCAAGGILYFKITKDVLTRDKKIETQTSRKNVILFRPPLPLLPTWGVYFGVGKGLGMKEPLRPLKIT